MPVIMQRLHKGFTLLEIMIALMVLAIGLLGLAHLQITSLKLGQTAEFRSTATYLVADIFDKMRANQVQDLDDSAYELAESANLGSCKTETDFGSDTARANKDLICWKEEVERLLPEGNASIECESYVTKQPFVCTVTLMWNEPEEENQPENKKYHSIFSYSGAI